jgi:uncharacterized protein (TIRG00374 family)
VEGGQTPQRARRPPWWSVIVAVAAAAAVYVGLPALASAGETWGRLSSAKPGWLAVALAFEAASYACYVFAFHRVFAVPGSRIGWRESYEICLAGVAATRVFAVAGAGGIAMTTWALERSGMPRRELVSRLTAFYVVIYAAFFTAMVVTGVGLRTGILAGRAPFGLTVVPAIIAGVVIAAALATAALPADLGERLAARLPARIAGSAWAEKLNRGTATVASGVRGAVGLVRRRDPALLGALGWWAFDIGVLWACFQAFGGSPPGGVVVMAYLVGQCGNALPLPGGMGGVEGGMIGAFIAFGVPGGLAVTVVLSYRAFAYWLPIVPGVIAYARLRQTVKAWDGAPAPAS